MKNLIKNLKRPGPKIYIPVLIILVLTITYKLFSGPGPGSHEGHLHKVPDSVEEIKFGGSGKSQTWTCSMHPHIQLPGPGQCPICGMTLIPVDDGGGDGEAAGPSEYSMSETAKKLAEIVTSPVERKFVTTSVRMVGKIDYDETRIGYITAWVPGRIDKLYVDYTGVSVSKGDHMVYLYSPELLAAQEELIQALRSFKGIKSSNLFMREAGMATLSATREKLRLWGLTSGQIKAIERKGKPSDNLTIYAPMGGVVIHKSGLEGMYVKTGTRIYTISDLSHLWVQLDAYESDLMWIRYGQHVEFTTEAYPGETFHGRIAFIDPVLNAKTRTVKVRVNVDNPDGKLKPEMFVHAVVHSKMAIGGSVMDTDLAGKWICPMHPEVVEEHKGSCPVCGMSLIRTESLGFILPDMTEAPLVVPASAVLLTGKRAVVYVEVPGRKRPTYEGRVIIPGPRADDYYIVRSGLSEGERVVTMGNFKIDSALQIQAKPSMMYPDGGAPASGHAHHGGGDKKSANKGHDMSKMKKSEEIPLSFKKEISNVIRPYLSVQDALSKDDVKGAAKAVKKMMGGLDSVDMTLLTGPAHMDWMKAAKGLRTGLAKIDRAKGIQEQRSAFETVSKEIANVLDNFGQSGKTPLYRFQCPMAGNGKGAVWIQKGKETRNPYYGTEMIGCGEMVGEIK